MAPAPLESREPDTPGQGSVPFASRDVAAANQPQAEPQAGSGRDAVGEAQVGLARRYAAVQAFDVDGIPVDPDPDWMSGRWDASPEADSYWAELEASLNASLDQQCVDPLNGLLPREFFDDESCDRPTDADFPELIGLRDSAGAHVSAGGAGLPSGAAADSGAAAAARTGGPGAGLRLSGQQLLDVVGRQEPALMVYEEAAFALVETGRALAWLEAHKFSLLNALYLQALDSQEDAWATPYEPEGRRPNGHDAESSVVDEAAHALRLPRRTAQDKIALALKLHGPFRNTLAALSAGDTSAGIAEALVDQAGSLPEDARTDFEAVMLPAATEDAMTRSKFAARARTRREREHPESIAVRHAKARRDRRIELHPDEDGMAWLNAYLPAEEAVAAFNRIQSTAISLQDAEESRTLTQLRADVLSDLLLTGISPGPRMGKSGPRIAAHASLTVPALTLLGLGEEPAELDGYGPIAPDVARRLVGDGTSFTRILTDPINGAVVALDRKQYRPTRAQRRFLRTRDRTCRAPGCNRAAEHCEIDHVHAYSKGGKTDVDCMCCFCKVHHGLKTAGYAKAGQPVPGTIDWTTAAGLTYSTSADPLAVTPPGELADILERHEISDLNERLKDAWRKHQAAHPPTPHAVHNGIATDLTPPPF
ncbi:DUF222 domain-containing protein [Arthrobacter sulfonylureivorans]|uniref:HNH endonuclease signature motif containing protein n=1 Tax=Arthrobacter sulfonylureivorans TaxID=2486855 RepID=UPI0039E71BEE